jgi:hypothetical protein
MKKLIRHKVFIGAFLSSYFLFFVLTISVFDVKSDGLGVGHTEHGFPFTYYYSNCFGGGYLWFGLIGNILFAMVLSIVVGLVSSHFWQKLSSPEFRAKWYI